MIRPRQLYILTLVLLRIMRNTTRAVVVMLLCIGVPGMHANTHGSGTSCLRTIYNDMRKVKLKYQHVFVSLIQGYNSSFEGIYMCFKILPCSPQLSN